MSDAPLPVRKEWIVELDTPIEAGGMTLSELKLREPTAQEMAKALDALGPGATMRQRFEMQFVLVQVVTQVPRHVLDKVPAAIITGAATWLEGFSPASPPITES